MPVETGSFITDLNPAWPLGSEDIAEGDEHDRLTKRFVQQSFPNVAGAATITHVELNTLTGISTGQTIQQQIDDLKNAGVGAHTHAISDVTNLQASLNSKAALTSPSFSGVPTVPTAASGNNSSQAASTAFVQGAVNNITIPDIPEYEPPTLCSFFPVNNSGQLPATTTDAWNVGFECNNFPASGTVQILYSFRGYWENLDLRTDVNGHATFSQIASAFKAGWQSRGGPLGVGYIRVRSSLDTGVEFTQNVNVY